MKPMFLIDPTFLWLDEQVFATFYPEQFLNMLKLISKRRTQELPCEEHVDIEDKLAIDLGFLNAYSLESNLTRKDQ